MRRISIEFVAVVLAIAVAASIGVVQANPVVQHRCNQDSLSVEQAKKRLDWARRCALDKSGYTLDVNNNLRQGQSLAEYDEYIKPSELGAGRGIYTTKVFKSYTTSVGTMDPRIRLGINEMHLKLGYNYGTSGSQLVEQHKDRWDLAIWQTASQRGRPLYPTYGFMKSRYQAQALYPHPTNRNDCQLYTDKGGKTAYTGDSLFQVLAVCTSSCYAPEQALLFEEGFQPIGEAVTESTPRVVTLTPDSTLDRVALQLNPVHSYTKEIFDTEHVIYELTTASGGQLRVTHEHPVIRSDGRVVQAHTLTDEDSLLRKDGTPDKIVKIRTTSHFGKVYNLSPESRDLQSNILIAEGYLVGSARYQNEDVGYINRLILASEVPREVIPD